MDVAEEVLALAKLRARQVGRAVVTAGALSVDIDADAFVLAPLKMAGEDAIWAVAFGRRHQAYTFVCAADSRNRDDETESVLGPLSVALDEYFRECLGEARAPQVWVASRSGLRLLDALADRRGSRDPRVALAARHAWFLADRYFHAGQQVLLTAVDVLLSHFASGQTTIEDQHLGALLAWIEPPSDSTAIEASHVEEDVPTGTATDVVLDMRLAKSLEELALLRREGRDEQRQRAIAQVVARALEPAAAHVYGRIERAIDVLVRQGLPRIARLDALRAEDANAFEFYMYRNFIPSRWSAKESSMQLASREAAVDRAEDILLDGDSVRRAIAQEAGEILEGRIVRLREGHYKGSMEQVEISTEQEVSRLRVGDIVRVDGTTIDLQLLESSAPDGAGTRVLLLRVTNGKTKVAPYLRSTVRLLPSGGNGFDRARGLLKEAHDLKPWILDRAGNVPQPTRATAPADPLAALEGLK